MAAALQRTKTHIISRPMACREAARHRINQRGTGIDLLT